MLVGDYFGLSTFLADDRFSRRPYDHSSRVTIPAGDHAGCYVELITVKQVVISPCHSHEGTLELLCVNFELKWPVLEMWQNA